MRILYYEIRKVVTSPVFIVALLASIVLNIVLLRADYNLRAGGKTKCDDAVFIAVHDTLRNFPTNEEKLEYIEDRMEYLSILGRFARYPNLLPDAEEFAGCDPELTERAFAAAKDPAIAAAAVAEFAVIYHIAPVIPQFLNYAETLTNITQNAQNILNFGFIAPESGFPYENLAKTVWDYTPLKNTVPVYDISEGIFYITNAPLTNVFCLVLILFCGALLMSSETSSGLWTLVKSTKRGRLGTAAAKFAAMLLLSGGICALLFASNAAYGCFRYGFGDLSRPIQSLVGYINSPFGISAGQYLVWFFILKCLSGVMWGSAALLLCTVFRSFVWPAAITVGLAAVGYAMCGIKIYSKLAFFRYFNLYAALELRTYFGSYLNLNILGRAVSMWVFCLVSFALLTALCIAAGILIFCRKPAAGFAASRFAARKGAFNPTGAFAYELKKLFADRGGILILLAAVCLQIRYAGAVTFSSSVDEAVCSSYVGQYLALDTPQERTQFLADERDEILGASDELDKLFESYASHTISSDVFYLRLQVLEEKSHKEPGFKMFSEQAEKIHGRGLEILPETGYSYLFGAKAAARANRAVLVLAVLLALSLPTCFCSEYENSVINILSPAKNGRGRLFLKKLLAMAAYASICAAIAYLPGFLALLKKFGPLSFSAPAASLSFLPDYPHAFTIGGYAALLSGIRLLGITLSLFAVIFISSILKKEAFSVVLSMFALAFPCFLMRLNLGELVNFSVYPMLSGVELLQMTAKSALCYLIPALLLAVFAALYSAAKFSRKIKL